MPARVQAPFAALWGLDLAFADIIATSSDARLGEIRLAWWRERLAELDEGATAPAEPRLQAVQADLLSRGVTGKELAEFEDAWRPLLEPLPWRVGAAEGLKLRGHILFGIGARLLGWAAEDGQAAGALWSLVDGAYHCRDAHSRMFLLDQARQAITGLPREKPPKAMRPLTVLAALAAHDALRNKPLDLRGSLRRGTVAVVHRLRGTLPRS